MSERAKMPNPSPMDLVDPLFEAIWNATKSWDVNAPEYYAGYCGLNGSHVMLILTAVRAAIADRPEQPVTIAQVAEALTTIKVTCKARGYVGHEPQDCDWPHCGCDLHAERVMSALIEEGWAPVARPEPAQPLGYVHEDGSARDEWGLPLKPGMKLFGAPQEPAQPTNAEIDWAQQYHGVGRITAEQYAGPQEPAHPPIWHRTVENDLEQERLHRERIAATQYVDIVLDGPPSHESGRFVEVEDASGKSIKFGEWVHRPDGYWALRIAAPQEPAQPMKHDEIYERNVAPQEPAQPVAQQNSEE